MLRGATVILAFLCFALSGATNFAVLLTGAGASDSECGRISDFEGGGLSANLIRDTLSRRLPGESPLAHVDSWTQDPFTFSFGSNMCPEFRKWVSGSSSLDSFTVVATNDKNVEIFRQVLSKLGIPARSVTGFDSASERRSKVFVSITVSVGAPSVRSFKTAGTQWASSPPPASFTDSGFEVTGGSLQFEDNSNVNFFRPTDFAAIGPVITRSDEKGEPIFDPIWLVRPAKPSPTFDEFVDKSLPDNGFTVTQDVYWPLKAIFYGGKTRDDKAAQMHISWFGILSGISYNGGNVNATLCVMDKIELSLDVDVK